MGNGLRDKLRELNNDLSIDLENLWQKSEPVHARQNAPGSNENGRVHVEMVEHNIWRLFEPWIENNYSSQPHGWLQDYEIFMLSAAACCHDFDKALPSLPKDFIHGEGSGEFVVNNRDRLGLDEHQADAVCSAVAIHDRDGDEFRKALTELSREEAGPLGTFNLHRVAVLLKASDTLHCDSSRISSLAADPKELEGLNKKKSLARSLIKGWRVNGTRVLMQAKPEEGERAEALYEVFRHMQNVEWPAVSEALYNYGFPHELELDDSTLIRAKRSEEKKPGTTAKNIFDLCPRCLEEARELSGQSAIAEFLKTAVKSDFIEALKSRGALQILREISDALRPSGPRPDSEALKKLVASVAPFHVSKETVKRGREQLRIDPVGKVYRGGVLEISKDLVDGGDAIIRAALFDQPCLWREGSLAGETWPKPENAINTRDVPPPATTERSNSETVIKRISQACRVNNPRSAMEVMYEWLYDGNPLIVLCDSRVLDLLQSLKNEYQLQQGDARYTFTELALLLNLCKEEHEAMAGLLERLRTIGERLALNQRSAT